MIYEAMKQLYPDLDDLIARVPEEITADRIADMCAAAIRGGLGGLDSRIKPAHRQVVEEKLKAFARAVLANRYTPPRDGATYQPEITAIAEALRDGGLCICNFCGEYFCNLCRFRQWEADSPC